MTAKNLNRYSTFINLADQTWEDLHFAIQKAYGWDADHLYSFFMSGKAWGKKTQYCLPEGYSPWGYSIDEMGSGENKSEKVEKQDSDPQRQVEGLKGAEREWMDNRLLYNRYTQSQVS